MEISEAIKPVKVPDNLFFIVNEGKAEFTKEIPQGSSAVPIPERKWAIIVANQESGENRSKVITARNRTELVRRTKQETRRLGNPLFNVTGGELRAVGPSGQAFFLVVTSWIWKGEPRAAKIQEGAYFAMEDGELIRAVQDHLRAGEELPPEILEEFLLIEPEPEFQAPDDAEEDPSPVPVKPMEAVAKAYALEGDMRMELLEETWVELGMSYLVVDEAVLLGVLESAPDRETYLEALGQRVIQQWPGATSFDRMLSEDRILVESEEALLVRVCSGNPLDARPTWARILESEVADHTRLLVDQQDLSAVGLFQEDVPGDQREQVSDKMPDLPQAQHNAPLGPGVTPPLESPSEMRQRIREARELQVQGGLFS